MRRHGASPASGGEREKIIVCRRQSQGLLFILGKEVKPMKRCWKTWAKAAGIRALRTVAQTAAATIGAAAVMKEVDWLMVGSAALMAGVLSLLTSLAGLPECKEEERGET